MKSWRSLATVFLSFVLLVPATVQALSIQSSFTGSSLPESTIVPDTMGAAGPDHFVELINGRYSVYRNADGVRVQTSTLNGFWQSAGVTPAANFPFDPRVTYDPATQRWFAASADNAFNANSFLVAVSNSSNPTQGWKAFAIPSDNSKTRWADFPTLGINNDVVTVAANMFPVPPLAVGLTTSILVLPKADLIAGQIGNRTLFENVNSFTVQPVVDPKSTGTPLGILLTDNSAVGQFRRSDIIGNITLPVLDTTKIITVPLFFGPPLASQPGLKAPLHTGGSNFSSSVVMSNGELWGVQSVNKDGRAALRWFAVNSATNELRQSGLIADPMLSFYYGSIAVNDFGNILVGFSGSGPSTFVGAYAVEGRTIGGLTTFDDPVLLKAGVADYQNIDNVGRNRWGDYSATMLDPDDPYLFWTIQEWVSATDIWSTQIVAIDLEPVPEPATLLLLGTTAAGLGLARWRQRRAKQHT